MAETFELQYNNYTIDLVYVNSSQTTIKTRDQLIRAAETRILEHVPDFGESTPVRGNDDNIEGWFQLDMPSDGSSWSTPLDAVAALKRWVDGKDQLALRHFTDGDVDAVKLKASLDGQTDPAWHTVKWGFVNDSTSYYENGADPNKWALSVEVFLRMEAAGKGDPILLRNDLPSSPHFLEDSNSDGLADGWEVQANITPTLNTSFWVVGGQSQKIVDVAGDNLTSGEILADAGYGILMQAYKYLASGTTPSTIVYDGGANICTPVTDTNYIDKTFTDIHGNEWSRVTKWGSLIAANATLIFTASAAATYYADACRLHVLSDYLANVSFEIAGVGGADVFASWTETASDGAIAQGTTPWLGAKNCTLTAGASVDTKLTQLFTSIPGQSYNLRLNTRGDGTYDGRYSIIDTISGKAIKAITATGVTGTDYDEVVWPFTAPPDCTSVRVRLFCPSTDTGVAYFDDVTVAPTHIEDAWVSTSILVNRGDTGRKLLANGDFETAGGGGADVFADWTEVDNGGTIVDSATSHGGTSAAQLTADASADTHIWQNIVVIPGRSYMLDLWTRSTTGDSASEYSIYDVTNATGIVARTTTGVTGETYTLFQKRFTAPVTCVLARIYCYSSDTDTDIVYFDDVDVYDEAAINYLDTWGVPGDQDALASVLIQANPLLSMVPAGGDPATLIASRGREGYYNLDDRIHWVDSDDLTGYFENGAGAWVQVTDATRANNNYYQFTSGGDETIVLFDYDLDFLYKIPLTQEPYRLFMLCRTSDSSNLTITPSVNYVGSVSTDARQLSSNNVWELVDLGLYNATGSYPRDLIAAGAPAAGYLLRFTLGGYGTADTFDVDALMFLPVNEIAIADFLVDPLDLNDWFVDAINKRAEGELTGTSNSPLFGSFYYVSPGAMATRTIPTYTTTWSADSGTHVLTNSIDTTVTVYPRTRHLLAPQAVLP